MFHFRYVDKIKEPEVMPEARLGKAIHKALELVLQGTPIPEATAKIQLAMIIIAALAEALTIYAFVTMFLLSGKIQ